MHVNGFTYGALTPVLAYAISATGSVLGLQSMSRARAVTGAARYRWLILSAASIGGTAIWVMHFIAMLGFTVGGVEIRYDVPLTLASMAVAVVVVGIGLLIVVQGEGRVPALLVGGLVSGSGVAAMHYMGMKAVHMDPQMHYDLKVVALSEAIAVAAATAAFWAALNIRGTAATIGAALIMAVAVTGMHYTGMAALHVEAAPGTGGDGMLMAGVGASPSGLTATQLLAPLVVAISVSTMLILLVVALAPSERDLREEAAMREFAEQIRLRRQAE